MSEVLLSVYGRTYGAKATLTYHRSAGMVTPNVRLTTKNVSLPSVRLRGRLDERCSETAAISPDKYLLAGIPVVEVRYSRCIGNITMNLDPCQSPPLGDREGTNHTPNELRNWGK